MEKKNFVVVVLNEMIYIGFLTMMVLNLVTTSKVEDRILLIIIELVFVFTRVYCKVKNDQSNKNKEKKGDRKYEKKDKRND